MKPSSALPPLVLVVAIRDLKAANWPPVNGKQYLNWIKSSIAKNLQANDRSVNL
jgi:hypothetical protein